MPERTEAFFIVALLATMLPLAASAQIAAPSDPTGPYSITNVDFEVTGITLPFVMMQKLDPLIIGARFTDTPALEKYIESQRQLLLNERVLALVEASYTATRRENGGYDVSIVFKTKDTWNIMVLPYVKYDSNSGLLLSARGRDYDFLGSMQALVLNLDYSNDTNGLNSVGNLTSFSYPFEAFRYNWSVGISEQLQIWFGGSNPLSITSVSLGLTIPAVSGSSISVSVSQGISFNAEAPDSDLDPWFLTDSFSLGASIPTSIDFGYLGLLYYRPSLSISQNWIPGMVIQQPNRGGTVISLTHSIAFGRVDWVENFKQGFSFSLSNSNSNTLDSSASSGDLSVGVAWYYTRINRFGLTARLQVVNHYLGDELEDMGSNLRGILDARISGVQGAFCNLSIPVKIIDFPTHLIIGVDWLDFELQAQPFLDTALVRRAGASLGSDSVWSSSGLELLVFPKRLRSFIVRASLGFDLKAVFANRSLTAKASDGYRPYEIFFGTGLMY